MIQTMRTLIGEN